jgi:(R,R)-butanediol dehydrogenase/meso-butanediol dehydrogenase/diacetyl reductase
VAWCDQFGLQGGGYAEFAVTRPNQCIVLPGAISLADGAIVEPLAVALHGVVMSGMKRGDRVLVLGGGPIGLAVAYWAKRHGAARVVVQDIVDHQRDRALAMGADEFVIDLPDPAGASSRALGGPADIVFECVGVPGLIAQAVAQVRNRGTILLLGLCTRPDTFNSFAMLSKEVRLVTSAFFTRSVTRVRSSPWPARSNPSSLPLSSIDARPAISDTSILMSLPTPAGSVCW